MPKNTKAFKAGAILIAVGVIYLLVIAQQQMFDVAVVVAEGAIFSGMAITAIDMVERFMK